MGAQPLTVPTIWLQGLWDQEDMWGAVHSYAAVEPKDTANDKNFLIMGPWFHSQINREGTAIGPFRWNGDTTLEVRRDIIKPFFDQYLKDSAPKANTPPVLIYNTGENHWDRLPSWPQSCESRCGSKSKPIYLTAGSGLSFTAPSASAQSAAYDEYVSDPAKPVPYMPRPTRFKDSDSWRRWLVSDQRATADRTPCLQARTPHHGAGAVDVVPAVRPQPADVRAQHLLREAVGLRQGDRARVSRRGRGQLHRPADEMIRTQQDYNITRSRADRLRAAIDRAVGSGPSRGEDPQLHTAGVDTMRRQLEELETQLREYDQDRKRN